MWVLFYFPAMDDLNDILSGRTPRAVDAIVKLLNGATDDDAVYAALDAIDDVFKADEERIYQRSDDGRFGTGPGTHRDSGTNGEGGKDSEGRPTKRKEKEAVRSAVNEQLGVDQSVVEAYQEYDTDEEKITLSPGNKKKLESLGFIDKDGKPTDAARMYVKAAEQGNAKEAAKWLKEGRKTAKETRAIRRAEAKAAREQKRAERDKARADNVKTNKCAFAEITKTEETPEGLIVEGVVSTERVDSAGEIVDYDSLKACLPDYLQWGNIREMHQPSAVGKALTVTPDDGSRTLLLRAVIVDDNAAKKVRAGVYKGYSVGGKGERKIIKTDTGTQTRVHMQLRSEISLADRPANADAKITLFKAEGMPMPDEEENTDQGTGQPDALSKVAELASKTKATPVKKAAADPAKIVTLIQNARNEAELAGDIDGSQLYTQAIALIMQASGDVDAPSDEETSEETTTDESTTEEVAFAEKGGNVKKAGRAISGGRMAALKTAAKALMQMAADAGDDECAAAMKSFGAGMAADAGDQVELTAKALGAEITKAMNPIADVILKLHSDVEALKKQPASGGPALRAVNKSIGTDQGGGDPPKPDAIVELRKVLETTTDPLTKQHLGEQIALLEFRRSRFGG